MWLDDLNVAKGVPDSPDLRRWMIPALQGSYFIRRSVGESDYALLGGAPGETALVPVYATHRIAETHRREWFMQEGAHFPDYDGAPIMRSSEYGLQRILEEARAEWSRMYDVDISLGLAMHPLPGMQVESGDMLIEVPEPLLSAQF